MLLFEYCLLGTENNGDNNHTENENEGDDDTALVFNINAFNKHIDEEREADNYKALTANINDKVNNAYHNKYVCNQEPIFKGK